MTNSHESDSAKSHDSSLRALPSVSSVLQNPHVSALVDALGRDSVVQWVRDAIDAFRAAPEMLTPDRDENLAAVARRVLDREQLERANRLAPVINATGIILHTGLGRAPLARRAIEAAAELAGAGNVEVSLLTGERNYRGHQLQPMWQSLTGCEDSLIVNNNAGATLLTLQALCAGREVVISRGQLIEIGGSFRLPEIFELSGAKLREVGTTNRTHLRDYAEAIGPNTAAIMHVHPSNYRVVGFSSTPSIEQLVPLAREHGVLAIDDIGSGSLIDVTRYGLPREPTFTESIAAGADAVLGSGDKLLGGPQAGIVLGQTDAIERIRKAPFARTVRVDKLTLAALSGTLELYLRGVHEQEVPTLRLLATSVEALRIRAQRLADAMASAGKTSVVDCMSPVGGGSLPGAELPSAAVAIEPAGAVDAFAIRLRTGQPRVFSRISDRRILLDLRSVAESDDPGLVQAVRGAAVTADTTA